MDAAYSFETFISYYKTTRCLNPEDKSKNNLSSGISPCHSSADNFRFLTAESGDQSQDSPRGICVGQTNTGAGFCARTFNFHLPVIFPCSTFICYQRVVQQTHWRPQSQGTQHHPTHTEVQTFTVHCL
jgi:hypothetical protein